jgi:HEAT repeat protein
VRPEPLASRRARLGALALVVGLPALLLGLGGEPTARPWRGLDRETVLAAFLSPEPARVQEALRVLRRTRPAPVDWLLQLIVRPERGAREWAAHALGDLAPPDDRVVGALMRAFEDPDDYVRWKAARALGRIGAPARRALALLEQAANAEQEVEVVRATAQAAVRSIRGP